MTQLSLATYYSCWKYLYFAVRRKVCIICINFTHKKGSGLHIMYHEEGWANVHVYSLQTSQTNIADNFSKKCSNSQTKY